MKILLVLPAADTYRVTRERPRPARRAPLRFSILPLTSVAAATPTGHEVRIVDENVEAVDLDADVDVVGIGFMTALAPRAYELAAAFRARRKRVVAGGYHATLCTEEALRHFDSVVVGDAEDTWPALLADLAAGQLQSVYRSDPCRPLRGVPPPRRDLVAATARHYITTGAVQAGRGCMHACRYCSIAAFHGSRYRARPIEEVVADVARAGKDLVFVDDNIVADPEHARRLFEALLPLRTRWVSQASLQIADDPALLALASRAGCRGLFIGIETLSAANLAAVGKSFNAAERYRDRIGRIRAAGIGVVAGIIVGLDGDGPDVFERTLRFLEDVRIDAVQVNILTPLPGTPLFAQLEREGRILDRDWSHYDFRHCVIRPARMSAAELQAGADWLYARFYRHHRILFRAARALFTLGPLGSFLGLRLNLAYRYDNHRERIVGWNPADLRRSRHASRSRGASTGRAAELPLEQVRRAPDAGAARRADAPARAEGGSRCGPTSSREPAFPTSSFPIRPASAADCPISSATTR